MKIRGAWDEFQTQRAALREARENLEDNANLEYEAYLETHGRPGFFSSDGPEESSAYLALNSRVNEIVADIPRLLRPLAQHTTHPSSREE